MALVNFRVLQGADRGRAFLDLKLPFTIGREEGNAIQLNDERISRYHLKIQEDNHHVILTDLDSTNGTRVNGNDCQLRILRLGDIIAIGRSVLMYGARDEIANSANEAITSSEVLGTGNAKSGDFYLSGSGESPERAVQVQPEPGLPERLSPSQAAQLSELLEFFHQQLGSVVNSVKIPERASEVSIQQATWHKLLQSYSRLSELIRSVGDPEG